MPSGSGARWKSPAGWASATPSRPPPSETPGVGEAAKRRGDGRLIKYLGSKRRLAPAIGELAARAGARSAIDVFTGTTRVAQELKRRGCHVVALDSARYAALLAECYVASDRRRVDARALERELARLDDLPGRDGYVTETFCRQARFFQPHNGRRIDAIRDAIRERHAGSPLEPLLLASLLEAADRVDSTTGVQMAYLKRWAPRSFRPLELRAPKLLDGGGVALRGDALELVPRIAESDLAYLDPPYNQHSYYRNYHVWETLVAWDAPPAYGVARKRLDCRSGAAASDFNSRRRAPEALRRLVASVPARLVVLSGSDEGWLSLEQLVEICAQRGAVRVLAFASQRYVGARIGIHNPAGERVGRVGRLQNVEYLIVAGERREVERAAGAAARTPVSLPGLTCLQ